jgi:hypothetical protein
VAAPHVPLTERNTKTLEPGGGRPEHLGLRQYLLHDLAWHVVLTSVETPTPHQNTGTHLLDLGASAVLQKMMNDSTRNSSADWSFHKEKYLGLQAFRP